MHPLSRGPNFAWTCNLFRSHRILNCAASILHSMVILRAAFGFDLNLSLIQLPAERENVKRSYFERVHENITLFLSNMWISWNIYLVDFLRIPRWTVSTTEDFLENLKFSNLTPHPIQTKVTLTIWDILSGFVVLSLVSISDLFPFLNSGLNHQKLINQTDCKRRKIDLERLNDLGMRPGEKSHIGESSLFIEGFSKLFGIYMVQLYTQSEARSGQHYIEWSNDDLHVIHSNKSVLPKVKK